MKPFQRLVVEFFDTKTNDYKNYVRFPLHPEALTAVHLNNEERVLKASHADGTLRCIPLDNVAQWYIQEIKDENSTQAA